MGDEFVQQFLGAPDTREVLEWLRSKPEGELCRSLGESGSTEDSIALAQEIYDAGAVEVLAVEIDDYEGEGQNTGRLVIKLPDEPDARKRVFAWAGAIAESHGFDPDIDTGQCYIFSMLD
jgi:hypothetical protein